MAQDQGTPAVKRTSAEIEAELASLEGITGLVADEGDVDAAASAAEAEAAIAADEDKAGRQGWVPKNLYKGPPEKWVDAATFVQRGERFSDNLQREVADLRKKLESFEGTKKAFMKFHEETVAAKDAELADTIKELRIQRSAASRNGEDELAVSIEDRIALLGDQREALKKAPAELDEPAAAAAAAAAAPTEALANPVLDEWIEDGNSWFNEDPKLRSYAIALGDTLIKNGETKRGRKFLDLVAEKMAEDFPRKFKAAAGTTQVLRPAAVEGGAGARIAATTKTERDLPAEDLALMKQFIKEGWTTKEKFLASYFSKNR